MLNDLHIVSDALALALSVYVNVTMSILLVFCFMRAIPLLTGISSKMK